MTSVVKCPNEKTLDFSICLICYSHFLLPLLDLQVCDFGMSRLKHHTFLSSKSTAGTVILLNSQ